MKTQLTVLSALSLVALMACQREKVADNPTYDPVNRTVNAKFILNLSTGTGSPDTKQTAADVQQGFEYFRGIEAAHLLTYSLNYTGVGGETYLYKPSDESSKAERDFDLGTLVTTADISEDDTRRILELALPLGTDAILIYGKAPKTGSEDAQGSVDYSGTALNSTLDNVSFKLNHRLTDVDAFKKTADLYGRILTGIMNSGRVEETPGSAYKEYKDNRYKFWWPLDNDFSLEDDADAHPGYTLYIGSKRWKDYGDEYKTNPGSMSGLPAIMGEAFVEVTSLKGEEGRMELRSGSAASICRLVNDMYNVVNRVLGATPTTPEEYIAQLIAREALTRASLFFKYDASTGIMNFRTRAEIMAAVTALIPERDASYYSIVDESAFYYKKVSDSDTRKEYTGFPTNFNLPLGAAIMSFQTVGPPNNPALQYIVVTYGTEIPAYGMGANAPDFSILNYCYPAELVYYVNSSIKTSDEAATSNNFPTGLSSWNDDTYWGSMWNGKTVESTTRSVAVSKPINYGTALLKSQFAYSAGIIEDNNGGVHPGENNNRITVSGTGRPFLVSGILIGGMDDTVGWNFLPKGDGFNKMIYDNLGGSSFAIPAYQSATLEYSSAVYTCVWDNYNAGLPKDAQSPVYVGLELVNNSGQDIWGELNLIRNGGTFYLIGELDPTDAEALKNFTKNGQVDLTRSDFFYPPFDETTGKTLNAPRVFMQDYVTTAKFKFSPTSLQHAYVTMPDLRVGQVSLGLSVDLTWEDGMEFEVVMGDVTNNNN